MIGLVTPTREHLAGSDEHLNVQRIRAVAQGRLTLQVEIERGKDDCRVDPCLERVHTRSAHFPLTPLGCNADSWYTELA